MRTYKKNWSAKQLVVNFNQKQWRQDLASYIANKLNWIDVRVTRSKYVEEDNTKEFEIFDFSDRKITIKYVNKNEIVNTSNPELVKEYMTMKGIIE